MTLKQSNYKSITALLLILVIAVGAVWAPLYVEASHGHDCSGTACPVCLTVSVIGSIHREDEKALAKAAAQGIPVVRSSHAGSGSVISAEASYEEEGFICGGSLSPQKARILLQLSLSKTGDFRDIQKIFDRY